jgi:lipopolysaccharide export system permease protein
VTAPRVARRLFLPVVGRHLGREFLGTFVLTVGAFVAIYVVADFFDRLDGFLRHDAPAGAIIRFFVFKIPLVVTQVTPVAVLVGGLVSLGLLARQNEFVALRACGVSVWQMAAPLLGLAGVIALATFAWNETIVPYSARRWHTIENVEIKKRGSATLFTGRDVWFHGRAGFYNVDRVSPRRHTLYGLTVYQVGSDFRPTRVIEAEAAFWTDAHWELSGVRTRSFGRDGVHEVPHVPPGFALPESLEDFRAVSIEPEELSYGMLRRQIKDLRRKGVDTSESWVDLHLKLALPAASLVLMLLAVPLAAAGTRLTSFAASAGLGLALGFGYFVLLAFTRALGQSGALPPALAAWAANGVCAVLGGYYLLGSD